MELFKKIQKKIHSVGFFKTISLISLYLILFPAAVLIRSLRPIIFIRFGSLCAEKIGPLASRPEMYLCEKENGIQPKNTIDIFFSSKGEYVCNYQLVSMWKRVLPVFKAAKYLYNIMNVLPFCKGHLIYTTKGSRDLNGLLEKSRIHLKFLSQETEQAKLELLKMGITEKDKYILMINRGQRYLDEVFPNINWDYHDYRNCKIENFMLMAEEFTAKGYFVIRMGHLVSDIMNTNNSKIIEYDNKGFRTDLLDVYLGANCRFIVSTDTGYAAVPGWIFRKPLVYVNYSQLEHIEPWLSSWLIIFKKYWLKKEKRFMKISEIIKSKAGKFHCSEDFKKNGIEPIENTAQEILDAASEMEERLNGAWQENDENIELQKRFWSYFQSSDLHGIVRSRIGAKFLWQNRDLLN